MKIKAHKISMAILYVLIALVFATIVVKAEEIQPAQTVKNDQAYATLNIQKQPQKENKQGITNHFTFFTINVQVNGKLDDIPVAEEK